MARQSVPSPKPSLRLIVNMPVNVLVEFVGEQQRGQVRFLGVQPTNSARDQIYQAIKKHLRSSQSDKSPDTVSDNSQSEPLSSNRKRGPVGDAQSQPIPKCPATGSKGKTQFGRHLETALADGLNPKLPARHNTRGQRNPIFDKKLYLEGLAARLRLAALRLVATRLRENAILTQSLERFFPLPIDHTPQHSMWREQSIASMAKRCFFVSVNIFTSKNFNLPLKSIIVDTQASTSYINSHFIVSHLAHRCHISGDHGEPEYVTLLVSVTQSKRPATAKAPRMEKFRVANLGQHGPPLVLGSSWATQK